MAKLQQHALLGDLLTAAHELKNLKDQQGQDSIDYRNGLKRVARLWSVLRMTRRNDEFLNNVTSRA